MDEQNVLGGDLEPCSTEPTTGYERDGCCRHHPLDTGRHEICAVMTEEFLEFSRRRGNDLITPRPAIEFPGLTPGDHWCVCVGRWIEAEEAGVAPPVVLEATNRTALDQVPRSTLEAHAHESGGGDGDPIATVEEGNGHRPETSVEPPSDASGNGEDDPPF